MRPKRRRKLTELEKETLSHLLEGLSNQEIAEEMGTNENCVKQRVRHVLSKLGLQNCRQLIPFALSGNTGQFLSG